MAADTKKLIAFPIPEQQLLSGKSGRKNYLQRLHQRVKSLPLANSVSAIRELTEIISFSNRLDFPPRERLDLLTKISTDVAQIMPALEQQVKDLAAPLTEKEEGLIRLISQAHFELALAYRCALSAPLTIGLFDKADRISEAKVVRNSIHHLGELARFRYLSHTQPKSETWKQIYSLYRYARARGIHQLAPPSTPGCNTVTIEDTLISVLLTAMSAPLTLRGRDFHKLIQLLPTFVPYAALEPVTPGSGQETKILVNLASTKPPKRVTFQKGDVDPDTCMAFNTTSLLTAVKNELAKKSPTSGPTAWQTFFHDTGLADDLIRNWSGDTTRGSPRISGNKMDMEVLIGAADIPSILQKTYRITSVSGMQQHDEDGSDHLDELEAVGVIDVSEMETIMIDTMDPDINPPVSDDDQDEESAESESKLSETGILSRDRSQRCRTVNFSSGGYQLNTKPNSHFRIHVGELTAVREENSDRWMPAAIRWVRKHGSQLDFGVKLLAPIMYPGTIKTEPSTNQRLETPCLVLCEAGTPPVPKQIILPSPGLGLGTTGTLEVNNTTITLALDEVMAETGSYVGYEFTPMAAKKTS